MRLKRYGKTIELFVLLCVVLSVIITNSSYSLIAENSKSEVLLIVGDQTDASPLSGIEVEIYHKNETGIGDKVGNFISQSEAGSDGHIHVKLTRGEYQYRVVTEGYHLPNEAEWESFYVEQDTEILLIWVISAEASQKEEIIEDEKIAEGSPKKENTPEKPVKKQDANLDEATSGQQGDIRIGDFKLNIVNNVWLTLGILAFLIFGIIGLDYLANKRN